MTPQDQILGLVNNYWQASCAGAAAQLQIADHLADGPLHVDVLAERTKTHAPSLFRMLRALECTGIFAQTSPRVFTNTPQSECLRRNLSGSQWAWIRICLCSDTAVFDGWSGLTKALQSGRTGFEEVRGCLPWEYLQARPEQQSNFNAAMRDLSAAMTPAVAAAYDWSRFPVIADIGGGIGAQLQGILEAHPSCRGILFDQPHVRGRFAKRPDRAGRRRLLHRNSRASRCLPAALDHSRLAGRSLSDHSAEHPQERTARRSAGVGGVGDP